MKWFFPLLFLLSCAPEREDWANEYEAKCSELEKKVDHISKEVAYGPRKCFVVSVVCIRNVQHYLQRNLEGNIAVPALNADTGKPYTCRK
jgi:hypothetical protein